MSRPHQLGRSGEDLAARILQQRGWRILDRNYRAGRKEIDLIARRGRTVAFVEVKTRTGPEFGDPLAAVTSKKRAEIARVARDWVARHGRPGYHYRFDAVAVVWERGRRPRIRHVEDAWRLD